MAKKAKSAKKAKTANKAKTATKAKKAKRSSQKRDLVKAKNAAFYAKRTEGGRFKDMDETGRAQKADRPRKAKKKAKSGYGDRGDR